MPARGDHTGVVSWPSPMVQLPVFMYRFAQGDRSVFFSPWGLVVGLCPDACLRVGRPGFGKWEFWWIGLLVPFVAAVSSFWLEIWEIEKICVTSSLDRCLAQARPVALLTWVLTAVTSEGRGQQVGNLSYFWCACIRSETNWVAECCHFGGEIRVSQIPSVGVSSSPQFGARNDLIWLATSQAPGKLPAPSLSLYPSGLPLSADWSTLGWGGRRDDLAVGKVRDLILREPENKGLLSACCILPFCISEALCFWQGRELDGEGALLCRQSAAGQTQLLGTRESRGNVGEHRKAGVMTSNLFSMLWGYLWRSPTWAGVLLHLK